MSKTREKIAPGVRIFGNALANITNPSKCEKPRPLGFKSIKHSGTTSLDASPCSTRNARIPEPVPMSSPLPLEDTHNLPSTRDTCKANEGLFQTAITTEDEFSLLKGQQRCPPGFQDPLSGFEPLNYPIHTSSVSTRYSMDSYSPIFAAEVPTNCSGDPSNLWDHFLTPTNYIDVSILPKFVIPQLSAPSNQSNAPYFNSPSSLSSHEKWRQSMYSLSATDLSLQISGQMPNLTPDCASPLNSPDSGVQFLSDDNDSGETSPIEQPFPSSMSYYHMANTPELSSSEKQVANEVLPTETRPEPKQAPATLISGVVNRRNVPRIQGENTCISSGRRRHTTLRINRANLPQSVVKYSSSEDSGADVSMDEDLSPSPSYAECRGCEALSRRVSLDDAQKQWKTLPDYGRTNFLSLRCKPGFIDSHCHLDFLFGQEDYKGTYTEYMEEHKGTYPASYEGCVAVFCHPRIFHKIYMWQKFLGENGVWGAFGCHPHHSKFYDSAADHHLTQAIQHSKVRALGEIGLDYSSRNNCSSETQHRVFRRQLKIALRETLPLVIHCRDANEDTMRILKEIIPRNYTIHLHCFTDGWDWAQKWLHEFPNLCIGITNLVTYASAGSTHDVAKRIPLDRLLLETDAPYFLPRKVPRTKTMKHSHPGMAIHVAAQIAALRSVSLKEIIHHTRQNTKKVYGI